MDVYAFGLVVLCMAVGGNLSAFMHRRWKETCTRPDRADLELAAVVATAVWDEGWRPVTSPRDLPGVPPTIVDLAVRCYRQDPAQRPSFQQVLADLTGPVAAEVTASRWRPPSTLRAANALVPGVDRNAALGSSGGSGGGGGRSGLEQLSFSSGSARGSAYSSGTSLIYGGGGNDEDEDEDEDDGAGRASRLAIRVGRGPGVAATGTLLSASPLRAPLLPSPGGDGGSGGGGRDYDYETLNASMNSSARFQSEGRGAPGDARGSRTASLATEKV